MVFQHRVCAAFRREVEKAMEANAERLYLVVHGGTIMAVMSRFARPEADYFDWRLGNCQGYRCEAHMGPEGLALTDVRLLHRVEP